MNKSSIILLNQEGHASIIEWMHGLLCVKKGYSEKNSTIV